MALGWEVGGTIGRTHHYRWEHDHPLHRWEPVHQGADRARGHQHDYADEFDQTIGTPYPYPHLTPTISTELHWVRSPLISHRPLHWLAGWFRRAYRLENEARTTLPLGEAWRALLRCSSYSSARNWTAPPLAKCSTDCRYYWIRNRSAKHSVLGRQALTHAFR